MTEEQFQARCRREFDRMPKHEQQLFAKYGYERYVSMMRKELNVPKPEEEKPTIADLLQAGDVIVTRLGSRITIDAIASDRHSFTSDGQRWSGHFGTIETLTDASQRVERNGKVIWSNKQTTEP